MKRIMAIPYQYLNMPMNTATKEQHKAVCEKRSHTSQLILYALLSLLGAILGAVTHNFVVIIFYFVCFVGIHFLFLCFAPKNCKSTSKNIALGVFFLSVLYLKARFGIEECIDN